MNQQIYWFQKPTKQEVLEVGRSVNIIFDVIRKNAKKNLTLFPKISFNTWKCSYCTGYMKGMLGTKAIFFNNLVF